MPIRSGSVQVTLAKVAWTKRDEATPGVLTLELVVDREIEEGVLQAAPENAAELLELLARGAEAEVPSPLASWVPALLMRT